MRLRIRISGETLGRVSVYALVIAVALTLVWSLRGERDFEYAAVTRALSGETEACPLSAQARRAVPTDMLSICTTFGLRAYMAAEPYPKIAVDIFKTYGGMKEFHEVLARHPREALPLIQFYRDNRSAIFDMYAGFESLMERLRGKPGLPALERDRYGEIAILELKRLGHELLARFELVDGAMQRSPIRSVLGAGMRLFTGGITDLEERIVRGERATWGEVAHAALDVGIIVFGVSRLIIQPLRAAKTTSRFAVFSKIDAAARTVHRVGRTALTAGAFATLAMLIYDPMFVLSGAAWVANAIGMWGWIGVLVLAMVVAWPLVVIVEVLWLSVRALMWPLRKTYRLGRWAQYRLLKLRRSRGRNVDANA
jgi:hypothetical protein